MKKFRITAVSYLNTLPYVYGITSQIPEDVSLMLDVPSECARKLMNREVDFGLAPVGILPQIINDYQPLPYCIGADGAVSTVMLYSRVPMQEIKKVHLDVDSRTSVLLVRILARHAWNINPEWIDLSVIADMKDAESLLAIGDKAFALKEQFLFAYDLGLEWKKMTGLPFVFAIWVARKNMLPAACQRIETALDYGVSHIQPAIDACGKEEYRDIDLVGYLTRDIHFRMNESFQKGMDTYLQFIAET